MCKTDLRHLLKTMATLVAAFNAASAFNELSAFFPSSLRRPMVLDPAVALSRTRNCVMGFKPRRADGKQRRPKQTVPRPTSGKTAKSPARVSTGSRLSVKRQIKLIRAFRRSSKDFGLKDTTQRFKQKKSYHPTVLPRQTEQEFETEMIELIKGGSMGLPVLLVDGFNVIFASPLYKPYMLRGEVSTACDMLINDLTAYAGGAFNCTIAFDARNSPHWNGYDREDSGDIRIVWAHDSADAWLEREAERLAGIDEEVMVVTEDWMVAYDCYQHGAEIASSNLLLLQMRAATRESPAKTNLFNRQEERAATRNIGRPFFDSLAPATQSMFEKNLDALQAEEAEEMMRSRPKPIVRPPKSKTKLEESGYHIHFDENGLAAAELPHMTVDMEQRVKRARQKKSSLPASSIWHSLPAQFQHTLLVQDIQDAEEDEEDEEDEFHRIFLVEDIKEDVEDEEDEEELDELPSIHDEELSPQHPVQIPKGPSQTPPTATRIFEQDISSVQRLAPSTLEPEVSHQQTAPIISSPIPSTQDGESDELRPVPSKHLQDILVQHESPSAQSSLPSNPLSAYKAQQEALRALRAAIHAQRSVVHTENIDYLSAAANAKRAAESAERTLLNAEREMLFEQRVLLSRVQPHQSEQSNVKQGHDATNRPMHSSTKKKRRKRKKKKATTDKASDSSALHATATSLPMRGSMWRQMTQATHDDETPSSPGLLATSRRRRSSRRKGQKIERTNDDGLTVSGDRPEKAADDKTATSPSPVSRRRRSKGAKKRAADSKGSNLDR